MALFSLILQQAVTPNSVGALVAWQQEDEVHVFTVEVKTWGESWLCVFFKRSRGLLTGVVKKKWKGKDSLGECTRYYHVKCQWCTVDHAPFSFLPWLQQINLGPWANEAALKSDSFCSAVLSTKPQLGVYLNKHYVQMYSIFDCIFIVFHIFPQGLRAFSKVYLLQGWKRTYNYLKVSAWMRFFG